jgi:TonB family protein
MSRVFVLNTADLLDSLTDFWRGCLTGQLIYDPLQKQEAEFSWQALPPSSHKTARNAGPDAANVPRGADTAHAVFHVGPEVKAPKAQHTPEPEFSEIARYEKFQGTVVVNLIVGTDGNVHDIRLVRPLGLGLDEAARSRLQTWRFRPATHNGQPVAVEMNIEVSFNLY